MKNKKTQDLLKKTETPEFRKAFEKALKFEEWDKRKLIESIRRSERITAKDLAVTINCRDTDITYRKTPKRKR